MKLSLLTSVLILVCLNGCSQSDKHNFHQPHKIPIDAKRWYQLNNPSTTGFEELFDEKQFQRPNMGYGRALDHYEAWYPLLDGEQMTIDSIEMFDWEGTNEKHPMTIYAVLSNWKRMPIAVFTGMRYNAWNGPDPKKPDVFALDRPVADIRYLVIDSWGDFPGEIEFYGSYLPPKLHSPVSKKAVPLKNFFGVNAFEWDFEEPKDPMHLDTKRLAGIANFTGVRHYMDWEKLEPAEGSYTFAPASNGSWNYDTIYQWCKAQNIEVLACLKTIPPWMQESYPKDQRDNENTPIKYGKDPADPASYIEQARVGFQYAARYGRNTKIDANLLHVGAGNVVRAGLGLVKYIECDNERDKWWKGRKGYQTGREYAANLSAFCDGNKGKLGPGTGVKNADPSMMVVMAGLAAPNPDFIRGMVDWCREFRGYLPDGNVDLPFDVINYHYYCNDQDYEYDKKQTTGIAPELTRAATVAGRFIQVAHDYAHDMPVWITESGYDINQKSKQRAIAIGDRDGLHTQADWILRSSLLFARCGIQRTFYYELIDDQPGNETNFATSGLINTDRTTRPASNYFRQVNDLWGNYTYAETLNNDPIVDRYYFDGQTMYMLVVPDQKGRSTSYALNLPNADSVHLFQLSPSGPHMTCLSKKITDGRVQIDVSETPVFVSTVDLKRITRPGK